MSSDYQYIDDYDGLIQLCEQLKRYDWFTLDTEFLREKTYSAQLCLLQIANPDLVACIDPLALSDLEPLRALLFDPAITKVLHSSFQDLEIFTSLFGRPPAPIFDTQVAATLLGHGEQIGYGNLVQTLLGIQLDKGQTRTDWCRRPLSPEQLSYAADDVRHLCDVYLQQRATLQEHGRIEWLADDFARLTDPETYAAHPNEAWRRVKGGNRLRGVQPTVLQQLAAWREEQAIRQNRPRRWIIKDDPLLDLARQMPNTLEKMGRIRGLEPGVLKQNGAALLALIKQAQTTPKEQWLTIEQGSRLSVDQEPLVDLLMALLKERCREQQITASAVAGRRDLELLVMGEHDLPLLHGWRAAIAGKSLLTLLEGRHTLSVEGGRLAMKDVGN